MCGIFGYAGPDARPEVLVEGIKRLEYRGYDSWGLCLATDNQLFLLRQVGRIGGVDGAALALPAGGTIRPGSPTRGGRRTGHPPRSTRIRTWTARAASP